ncbi:MAG TPA: Gfo/Idh/MocA family oxidoreductase [Pseudonocardia sp.]|nr:Gfo/Idh/MocA family oxidoreductase [Pseudonocardia sp.]
MDQLRVGLVGGGPWARTVHAPGLAAHPGTVLAGIWTRRRSAAEELAAEFGGTVHDSVDDLLDDVDAVAFAVPPDVQATIAVRAAEAGRHLVCDKPLGLTVAEARAVAEAVAAAGVCSTLMLTMRFEPAVRDWLAGIPDAGPDTVGSAQWLSGALLGGRYATSPWRAEHGALLDVGPHVIDLLDAALGTVTGVEWAHYDEPDLWRFGLRHDGGSRSTASVSLRLPIDPSEVTVTVLGGAGRHRFPGRPGDVAACYVRLLDEFVAAVRGDGPPPAHDAARGLHLQEIIEAVRAEAARGEPAPLP